MTFPITRILRTAAALSAAVPAAAVAAPSEVVPGITYERLTPSGHVIHVTRITQGPLVSIRPERMSASVDQRGRLTSAVARRAADGAVVGVNGDYFNLDNGYPSGLLVQDGQLLHEPEATRSALMFLGGGRLTSGKVALNGSWTSQDPAAPQVLNQYGFIGINRPAERDTETVLYTPHFGDLTPTGDRVDALIDLEGSGVLVPNRDISGVVQSVKTGGGSGIGPGKFVLSGIGPGARNRVETYLKPGFRVTLNAKVPGLDADLTHALGGGPVLVSDGRPVADAGEGFGFSQVGARTARTAVGQTAEGQVLLVVVEGPGEGRRGMTAAEHASFMAALGAQTAVGMDGGGSAGMAIGTKLVNAPAAGERSISNGVIVRYRGVQLSPPAGLVSPNRDGVADSTRTVLRSARPGSVRVTLNRADGRTALVLYQGQLGASPRPIALAGKSLGVADGTYDVVARMQPSDGTPPSSQSRRVIVDRTLGALRVTKVGPRAAQRLRVGFVLRRRAATSIVIQNAKGATVRVLMARRPVKAGARAVLWDMRKGKKRLPAGLYTVTVFTRQTASGSNALTARFRVAKPPPPKPSK